MTAIKNTFNTVVTSVVEFIIAIFYFLFPPPKEPTIDSFSPLTGWPGTIVTLTGKRFSIERDGNLVKIGGDRALILEAAENELTILAGENTSSGPITVQTANGSGTAATNFQVLPYPDMQDISQAGPPVFFHGPQPGTPKLGVKDQKVLVILCHASDQAKASEKDTETIKTAFSNANRYWREASYDGTTWKFSYSPWLALDEDRNFYAWQKEDIDEPLKAYLEASKHGLRYRQGKLYAGFDLNFLSEVKVTNTPPKANEVANLKLSGEATAVHIEGNRAYVAAGKAGLYIFDIDAGPANQLKHISSPYWLCGLDAAGNRLVVAALDGGVLIFDKSISANPQLLHTFQPVNSAKYKEWVTAVKIVDNQLMVGIYGYGTGPYYCIRLYDISTPTTPVTEIFLGGLVREIARTSSGLCAVATDGGGVEIFDVGSGSMVRLADKPITVMPYALSVALANDMAYVAGGSSGFQIVDLTDPKNPVIRGQLATAKAVTQVTVEFGRAYLCSGARGLMVVDVSNPDNPQPLATTTLGTQTSSSSAKDPDLADLRAKLHVAIDMHTLAQDFGTLLAHAIKKARYHYSNLPMGSFDILDPKHEFVGFIAVMAGPFLRGQSFVMDTLKPPEGSYSLKGKKGLIYLAQDGADWSRIAHEIGHWFGMDDIYEDKLANGKFVQGTAAPWCMSGDGWELFCAYQMHERMHFYSVIPEEKPYLNVENLTKKGNILECHWSATAPPLDKTFTVVAHGKDENTDPKRFHILKLIVSDGLVYYVEVRQRQDGSKLIFDKFGKGSNLPCSAFANPVPLDNVGDSAVVVTRATTGQNMTNNSSERIVMHLGKKWYPPASPPTTIPPECDDPIPDRLPLDVGDQVVDAARRLTIEVVKKNSGEDPISYDIRIKWNEPTKDNPDGKVNPSIKSWSTDTWDTDDIWIDRYNNNDSGVLKYDNHEPGDQTKPLLNGDRPLVEHENMIYARIHNGGILPVDDVYVTFYATSPPGIGDNGKWETLGTDHIQTIPAGGEALAKYPWIPKAGKHSCLRVEIMPRSDETTPEDNCAQENVFDFDSPGGSSHKPVVIDAAVRSPFTIWRKIDLRTQGLPPGWHVVVNHGWVWTSPKGEKAVTAVIWTDLNAPYSFTPDEILLTYEDEWEIPNQALARIEGWTSFDHLYEPIGGLSANVKANKKVVVEYGLVAEGSNLTGNGCLVPPLADVPLMIEAVDSTKQAYTFYLKTDSQGCFDLATLLQDNPNGLELPPGAYSVWVYVLPGSEAAETTVGPTNVVIS